MNTKNLNEKTPNLIVAYLLYFSIQAPYGYVNQWGYQLLYWFAAMAFYSSIFNLLGLVDTKTGTMDVTVMSVLAITFATWAVHVFFALPNMVKKENLRLYEIMSNNK